MKISEAKYNIGILVSQLSYYTYPICHGVTKATEAMGANSFVFTLVPTTQQEEPHDPHVEIHNVEISSINETLKQVVALDIHGLIINSDLGNFVNPKVLESFAKDHPDIVIVTIGGQFPGCCLVSTDNYRSSFAAVEHLIENQGARQIAYIRGPEGNVEAEERYRAYLDAIKKHNLNTNSDLITTGDWFVKSGEACTRELIEKRGVIFDALVAANDNMINGALDVLIEKGIAHIPVFGFDNNLYAESLGFSTVDQCYEEMARSGIEEILACLDGKPRASHVRVPGKLILRKGHSLSQEPGGVGVFIGENSNQDLTGLTALLDSFDSQTQETPEAELLLKKDVKITWYELAQLLKEDEITESVIDGVIKRFQKTLKSELDQNLNIIPWLGIVHQILLDVGHINKETEELKNMVSTMLNLTISAVEKSYGQMRKHDESMNYDMNLLGQRLMSCEDYESIAHCFRSFMKVVNSESAFIAIYDQHESENRNVELLCLTDPDSKSSYLLRRYFTSEQELKNHLFDMVSMAKKSQHLYVLPIGQVNQNLGYMIVTLTDVFRYWPLYRALQLHLSQAFINVRRIQNNLLSEREARIANNAKSVFLSRMTHELRTPMNGVIGMTSLLLDTELTSEQQDFVNTIRSSGDTLLSLINEILDLSKIEANKLTLEEIDFNLVACIEDALDLVSAAASEKQLQLTYDIEDDVPMWVRQDLTRVRQVISNLLSNAVKFTQSGSVSIYVSVIDLEKNLLSIRVIDSGIGVTDLQAKNLFKPFSQADRSIHRKFGGTGLGLVISKNISNAMGGDLVVEPTIGQGSIFNFTFAYTPCSANPDLEIWQKPIASNAPLPKLKILNLDASHSRLLKRAGSLWGIEVEHSEKHSIQLRSKEFSSVKENQIWVIDISSSTKPILALDQMLLSQTKIILLADLNERVLPMPEGSCSRLIRKPLKVSSLYSAYTELIRLSGSPVKELTSSGIDKNFALNYPLKILLAEDNLVNQKVAKSILERCGYRVDLVGNGKEALESCYRQPYEVVLMDVFMPEMDGTEATQIIRRELPSKKQPFIIAVTANAQKGDREKLLAVGMNDYIRKPILINELLKSLRKAYEHFHQQE